MITDTLVEPVTLADAVAIGEIAIPTPAGLREDGDWFIRVYDGFFTWLARAAEAAGGDAAAVEAELRRDVRASAKERVVRIGRIALPDPYDARRLGPRCLRETAAQVERLMKDMSLARNDDNDACLTICRVHRTLANFIMIDDRWGENSRPAAGEPLLH